MQQLKKCIKTQLLVLFCAMFLILGITQAPTSANAEEVSSISIDTAQTVLRYEVGSVVSLAQIRVFVNEDPVSLFADTLPGAALDLPENDAVGRRTLTLSYGGQTAAFEIVVVPRTPSIYSLIKKDFDTVRAYSTAMTDVTGCNFRTREAGSTQSILMGFTTEQSPYNRYYDTVQLLKPGKTYLFKVRSYVIVDGEYFYSDWSAEKTIDIPKLYGAEAWRWEAKRQLLAHGVYTKYRLDIIVNIIDHESGGSQTAGQGRYYVGLMQFGAQWKHDYSKSYFADHKITNFRTDNRLSGSWSLHRVAHLIKYGGGTDALKRHWPSTWDL